MMNRAQKAAVVDQLAERIAGRHFYIADIEGLTVSQMNTIRKACFEQQVELTVVKNSLLQKTLDKQRASDAGYKAFSQEVYKKGSAVFIVSEQARVPARIIQDFKKTHQLDAPVFKGAFVYGDYVVGEDKLEMLSQLKSKEELLQETVLLLQSPMQNLLSTLSSGGHKIHQLLQALLDKK